MKTLALEKKEGVLTVTLNRPDVHNAFNEDMMQDLLNVFTSKVSESDVVVVVLRAAGKSFCAGGDLNYMKSAAAKTSEQNVSESLIMASMFQAIDECPKPVLSVVQGAVMGGGVGLVSVCDIVIADEKSFFSLSEVKLGLCPSVISPFVMRKIGASAARRYFVSAERFDAHEARRIGLVHEVVSDETREEKISTVSKQILGNGRNAMAKAKELIRVNLDKSGEELTNYTAAHISELRASQEAQGRMRAFLEKSK